MFFGARLPIRLAPVKHCYTLNSRWFANVKGETYSAFNGLFWFLEINCMRIKRLIIIFTSLAFFSTGLIVPAQGAMLATQDYLQAGNRQASLAVIDTALMRADVQQQLTAMGVDPANAMQRIASLPDQDVAKLAEQFESMPAGGILGVIGIVFVVLLILELTGVIDIFKKI
jgi:hypothetical protein